MNLGFHYHVPAKQVGEDIYMPAFLGVFIDSLGTHFDQIVCLMYTPLPSEEYSMDYKIRSNNVQLVTIGEHASIPIRILKYHLVHKKKIEELFYDVIDVVLIRASTPLLPWLHKEFDKPQVVYIVSSAVEGIESLPQPGWRKKLISFWANWYDKNEQEAAKHSMVLVNNIANFERFKLLSMNVELVKSTTLSKSDLFKREDTCQGKVVKLLFAGRVTESKGILDIVQAMFELDRDGYPTELNIVGMLDSRDPILDKIEKLSAKLGIQDSIQFHGYKTAGNELLQYYRNSDIFISASKASSEGFPRTIWEALGSSAAVLVTDVSSISKFVEGCAVVVKPNDIDSLVFGLKELIDDQDLRKNNIENGYKLAEVNTLDKRAEQLASAVDKYVASLTS